LDAGFVKSIVLVACVTVVLVALIVVGGLVYPPGEADQDTRQLREQIPSMCEQLRELELNRIQRCHKDDSHEPVTVRL
jgi:Tfp pilus assembly protein PilN